MFGKYTDSVKNCKRGEKKLAFTLSEVLIVVAILGVVAALVLPPFIQDFGERINSNRQANIVQKITKSVELMAASGDYEGIYTTDEFVDKLQKHLKIIKRCDANSIADCWPTKTIKTAKGEVYNVSNAKSSKDLHVKGNTDNVGLVLADGASIILTFNPNAPAISGDGGFTASKKELPIGRGKTKEFAYSSSATGAIDFVMDVNGAAGPNQEPDFDGNYYDIRSFKTAAFSQEVCAGGIMIEKRCIVDVGEDYEPLDCTKNENTEYCYGCKQFAADYYAGGNKTCSDMGLRLLSAAEWKTFTSGSTAVISGGRVLQDRYGNNAYHPTGTNFYVPRNTKYPLACINDN